MAVRRSGALKRQNDGIAAAQAYRRVKAACDAVEAHIAAQGTQGLAEACKPYIGACGTTKTAIIISVNRLLGKEARDEIREVLCV